MVEQCSADCPADITLRPVDGRKAESGIDTVRFQLADVHGKTGYPGRGRQVGHANQRVGVFPVPVAVKRQSAIPQLHFHTDIGMLGGLPAKVRVAERRMLDTIVQRRREWFIDDGGQEAPEVLVAGQSGAEADAQRTDEVGRLQKRFLMHVPADTGRPEGRVPVGGSELGGSVHPSGQVDKIPVVQHIVGTDQSIDPPDHRWGGQGHRADRHIAIGFGWLARGFLREARQHQSADISVALLDFRPDVDCEVVPVGHRAVPCGHNIPLVGQLPVPCTFVLPSLLDGHRVIPAVFRRNK